MADFGTTGDDSLMGGSGADTLVGDAGHDTLQGGAGQDLLQGDDGHDFLRGGADNDTLEGGAGDDFLVGSGGDDSFVGGAGNDRVAFGDAPGGVTVDLTQHGVAQNTGDGQDTLDGIEHVSGTPFADRLTGDGGANWIWGNWNYGGQPGDTLKGGGGDDVIMVGTGDHQLDGEAGEDTLNIYQLSDLFASGVRLDLSQQGGGQATGLGFMTLNGFENLSGGVQADSLTGDAGANRLFGDGGDDSLRGGAGNDVLSGDGALDIDSYEGGSGPIGVLADGHGDPAGHDTLEGGAGEDSLLGGQGDDILRGEADNDTLEGGAGADFLVGGAGDDRLDGGAGWDRVGFSQTHAGVTATLATQNAPQTTGEGSDTFVGIEHLSGTNGNDNLTGDGSANWLWGTGGSDTLNGGGGDDLLSVGRGDHVVDGGAGTDVVSFYSITLTGPVKASLASGVQNTGQGSISLTGVEGLTGTLYGGDTLTGDGGNNIITGWGGSDSLSGGAGDDFILGDGATHIADDGAIETFDDATLNMADPPPRNDTINTGSGDDTVHAGVGDDRVILAQGSGEQALVTLGGGGDVLVLDEGFAGTATITDFQTGAGGDALSLDAFLAARLTNWNGVDNPYQSGHLRLRQDGADTVLEIDANGGGDAWTALLRFEGATATAFTDANLGIVAGTNGTSGADSFAGTAGPDVFSGLGGADTLYGAGGDDRLIGGGANDTLRGEAGNDTLEGGADHDLLTGGAGNDRIDGGAGYDRASFNSSPTGVTVTLATQGSAQTTGEGSDTLIGIEHLTGSDGNDNLTGDGGGNWLWGTGGSDTLSGGGGADLLSVGRGNHVVDGGADTDVVSFYSLTLTGPVTASLAVSGVQNTGQGTISLTGVEGLTGTLPWGDTLTGDANGNILAGWGGGDSLSGGGGDDLLLGDGATHIDTDGTIQTYVDATSADAPAGADTLDGGAGADTLRGWAGADVLVGGTGADILDGGAGDDTASYAGATAAVTVSLADGTATGGADADTLVSIERVVGSAHNDALLGGAANDTLSGGAGDDQLRGDAGDDYLDGGANGPVVIQGGFGGDSASYRDATGGVTVSLAVGGAQTVGGGQGVDTLVNIENLFGGAHNDALTGDGGSNFLLGRAGDDTLAGGGADDILEGGSGDDRLDGGGGIDTAAFTEATSGITVNLGTTTAQAVGGGLGSDTLVSIEAVTGSGYGDTLTGTAAANWFDGGAGGDSIVSGAGADTIFGGAGDDSVSAQAGSGEVTQVTLNGGADRVVVDAGMGGAVRVTDFQTGAGGDRLDFTAWLQGRVAAWNGSANPFEAGYLRLVQDGSSTLVQLDPTGNSGVYTTFAVLQNTSSLLFTQENFGFAPLPKVVGGSAGDTFKLDTTVFTPGSVDVNGDAVTVEVDGGGGDDVVEIVAPALVSANATASIAPSADGTALLLDLDGDTIPDVTLRGVEELVLNGERVVVTGDLSRTGLAPNTIVYNGTSGDNLFDASGMLSEESVRAYGEDGADTLVGGGDDDTLDGGSGADKLTGGGDNDILVGDAGNDELDGGAGEDTAVFSGLSSAYTLTDLGGGVLRVAGPDGTDQLTSIERLQFDDGAWGRNTAPAGADKTVSISPSGGRTLTASDFGFTDADGDDLGAVTIVSLPASGTLRNNGATVTIGQVVSGADVAAGRLIYTPAGVGSASFTFQVRDDGLVGWGSNQDATANTLTLQAVDPPPPPPSGPSNVISSGTQGTEGADLASFGPGDERFSAGGGSDTVSAGAGADWVHGNGGDDSVSAGLGADTVYGGQGDDLLRGDDGDDYLSGDLGADSLQGGAGNDAVFGGAGDDRVEGGDGDNYLRGGEGADIVVGGLGFDDAHGNEGDDTVAGGGGADWVVGGKDNDRLFGEIGDDIVYGNLGADTCEGGDGADVVRGGQGDDLVLGGIGNDWLSGDRGDDTLTGGVGADTFHAFAESGLDRVVDFSIAEGDRVQLLPGAVYTVAQVGADTVVDLGGGGQLVLVGVQLSSLPTGWILS
ncbi:hypothetical protein [Phenylobacterium sp.]|uniref:hypothetical protein n=1 Tax=Phenylobacterium sp. TaxID=1871053 RepID=UPI0035B4621D